MASESATHEERLTHPVDRRAPRDFERRVGGAPKLMRRSCGTCVNYSDGRCTLYDDMPVQEGDICEEYERGRGKLLFGTVWLAAWVVIALLAYLIAALL